ncbi:MAG: mechanosensitive ion channel family protein [Ignavibacteriae bacterium]|nr:mechanosensitive ion channel family protein [Ignavibacteriota bacterium]NOG98460.1 mechanosensitive ion channel family protein [Ignavibacteriota bacterium]
MKRLKIHQVKVLIIALLFCLPGFCLSQSADTVYTDSLKADSAKIALVISSADTAKTSEKKSEDKNLIEKMVQDDEVTSKLSDVFSPAKIIWAIIFLAISFFVIKFIIKILSLISEKSTRYRLTLKGLIPIVRILAWTASLSIVIIVIFAPPIESLVVVTGSLGIAVGFASQDILKNIFGGIMIIFDRTFQVGDKVAIGEHYGEVLNIGLRSTRIVTADDSVVSVPNGDLISKAVSNSNSGETNCQVVAEFYLPPYIDTAKARDIAIQAAQVSRYVYLNKPITVIFINEVHHGKPFLKMRLKAYVLDIRYEFAFMSDMTESTIKELVRNELVTKEELAGEFKDR